MMKKLALLLAVVLAILCCGAAYADDAAAIRPYYQLDPLGIKLYVDASWESAARGYEITMTISTDYDDAGSLTSGMLALLPAAYQGEDTYDQAGVILGISVAASGMDAIDYGFAGYEQTALGSVEGYDFTLHVNPAPDTALLDEAGTAMVATVREAITAAPGDNIELSRPQTVRELNTLIKDFSTQDIFGQAVDKSVLQNAPYTLIDVWATFCTPCINEMPELAELAAEYEGRVQFMGILTDVTDEDTLALAQAIVDKTGVQYPSILPDESLYMSLLSQIQYTPTKLIVDSDGVLIGEPIIGAQGKDALRAVLEALPAPAAE